jgi:hypothetical protein
MSKMKSMKSPAMFSLSVPLEHLSGMLITAELAAATHTTLKSSPVGKMCSGCA